MQAVRLTDATWPTVGDRPMVLVPMGSLEQHGPHLPLDTDTAIASAVAERVAAQLAKGGARVMVAPALAYGASGEHQAFSGTVSVGHEVLRLAVVELVRSLSTWSGRIVLVNGHGGNIAALSSAVRQLVDEGHDVCWTSCSFEPSTDAHAGLDETSVMLALAPERVSMTNAAVGNTADLRDLMPELTTAGVASVSSNGVLGDPTGATSERGVALLDGFIQDAVGAIAAGVAAAEGRLRLPHRTGAGG